VHYCTFRGYEAINKKIFALRPDGNRGSWNIMLTLFPYVTLLWNMLSRCASIADLGWEHFSWSGDSMTIKVPGSKCDQAGIYAYAKRLYANTLKPWICPVLACALAFFCRKERSSKVFYCGDTVRNSLRHFREICSTFSPEECKELGCHLPTLAWHDFKRGGVSFLSSLTDAVNNVAVKIRADHRIVDISRCYVLETSGQDGLIGRLLSGLPYGEAEFANTCPHFTSTPGVDWETLVSDYKDFTPAFRDYVIPHLLATIAFHLPWIEENLPPNHPFLTGFGLVNRKMLQEIAGKVSGGKVASQERRAAETGISAAVKTSIRVQQLEAKVVDAVQSAVTAAVSKVLEQQCSGEASVSLVGAVSAAAQTAAAAVLQHDTIFFGSNEPVNIYTMENERAIARASASASAKEHAPKARIESKSERRNLKPNLRKMSGADAQAIKHENKTSILRARTHLPPLALDRAARESQSRARAK
jgi:hypothetical protein